MVVARHHHWSQIRHIHALTWPTQHTHIVHVFNFYLVGPKVPRHNPSWPFHSSRRLIRVCMWMRGERELSDVKREIVSTFCVAIVYHPSWISNAVSHSVDEYWRANYIQCCFLFFFFSQNNDHLFLSGRIKRISNSRCKPKSSSIIKISTLLITTWETKSKLMNSLNRIITVTTTTAKRKKNNTQ